MTNEWTQDNIVLNILTENRGESFTVDELTQYMEAHSYPEHKRRRDTIQTVLSRLARQGKCQRYGHGRYIVPIQSSTQEHGEVMRAIGHSNSSEEFGCQEHSVVMDAILGRDND